MIGHRAPDWQATAWMEGREVVLRSDEYAGMWYVIYFYPLDFTFVCPTEIRGFEALDACGMTLSLVVCADVQVPDPGPATAGDVADVVAGAHRPAPTVH